jgi:hypothetical protein
MELWQFYKEAWEAEKALRDKAAKKKAVEKARRVNCQDL